jgi:acyl-CoA thioesterase FadM
MKFEIIHVCYQYLGCSWITYWRNNLGIKKKEKKEERITGPLASLSIEYSRQKVEVFFD